jgi:L-alanine-DL-glutamate epimerase-like enolase superfamily enzyme
VKTCQSSDAVATFDTVAQLPLEIESFVLEGLSREVSSGFTRHTTVVRLSGRGEEGIGEDATYDTPDHVAFQAAGDSLPLAGSHTIDSFSGLLTTLTLFPEGPQRPVSEHYRRWAFESAALDLALRQAGRSLADVVGRVPRPVTFVISTRLPDPPSAATVRRLLERYPSVRFKLDPTSDWTDELVEELRSTGAVVAVDLKGLYTGTIVDQPPDAALYERVARGLPGAWIEDPALTPETEAVLAPYRDRITWDEPIHSVNDIEARPYEPRMINVKPSRFGTVQGLFDAYDLLEERGIRAYGGGQFELGPGRGQIQYLASLFHPDEPNDVAPSGFNDPDPPSGLPGSPLAPAPAPTGFRWGS